MLGNVLLIFTYRSFERTKNFFLQTPALHAPPPLFDNKKRRDLLS